MCCIAYCVTLGLYWTSLLSLELVTNVQIPFSTVCVFLSCTIFVLFIQMLQASSTLFVLFHVAALITTFGAFLGLAGQWKHHLKRDVPFVDTCVVFVTEFFALLVPVVFYLVACVFIWFSMILLM
jgi:hypothetical protein